MSDEPSDGRGDRGQRAQDRLEARRRRGEQESAQAQALIDRFVGQAKDSGLPAEELMARPWSGRGRYRTGVDGWYLRRDHSIGIGVDGSYYVLLVAPVTFGRWRTVHVQPSPPPLLVGEGGRDGDAATLDALLEARLHWSGSAEG
jgi:hypothetical protein